MSVTVVTCCYGGFDRFYRPWIEAVRALDPAPTAVNIGSSAMDGPCDWRHPQAFYLQRAIERADTEWVVIADIDDTLFPDALAGLEDVTADVWQMGFERSDGETYIPPTIDSAEYLASPTNMLVGASAVRLDAFRACGGYPDVALQDWALWRRLARNGATFESSGRTHFRYNRHPLTRGETELTMSERPAHLAEMMESELVTV